MCSQTRASLLRQHVHVCVRAALSVHLLAALQVCFSPVCFNPPRPQLRTASLVQRHPQPPRHRPFVSSDLHLANTAGHI